MTSIERAQDIALGRGMKKIGVTAGHPFPGIAEMTVCIKEATGNAHLNL